MDATHYHEQKREQQHNSTQNSHAGADTEHLFCRYILYARKPKPAKLKVRRAASEKPIPMSGAVPKGPSDAGMAIKWIRKAIV
jgi:hypothetical protein